MAAQPEKPDLGVDETPRTLEDQCRENDGKLRAFIRMQAPRSDEQEDILQAAYLKLLKVEQTITIRNWLSYAKQTILNEIRFRGRKNAKRRQLFTQLPADDPEEMAEELPEWVDSSAAEIQAQEAELVRLVQMLPPRPQLVFWLCYIDEYTYAQSAAELRVSPATIKLDLRKILRHFRAHFNITLARRPTKDDHEW